MEEFKNTLSTFQLVRKADSIGIFHCYHVNDFPLVNSTPGIIQDPIDLLLAKCNSDIGIGFQCLQYLCQNWVNCTLPNSDIGIGFQYYF